MKKMHHRTKLKLKKSRNSDRMRKRIGLGVAVVIIVALVCITAFAVLGKRSGTAQSESAEHNNQVIAEANDATSDMVSDTQQSSETLTEPEPQTQEQTELQVTESQTQTQVQAPTAKQEEEKAPTVPAVNTAAADFVSDLSAATKYSQLIIVSAHGVTADVTMHERQNGVWTQIMSTQGYVGKDGVGPASEDTSFTPVGEYSLTFAFGINSDPGSAIGYTQVDDSDYWVDDPKSQYYNLFVSTNQVTPDWDSAEHLNQKEYQVAYAYAININYNMKRTPGDGSAIFLHCSNGSPTAGCVAIPQKEMVFVLTHIGSSCGIVIDNANSIMNH